MKTFWRTVISVVILVVIVGINKVIFGPGFLQTILNGLCLLIVLLYNQFKPPKKNDKKLFSFYMEIGNGNVNCKKYHQISQ